MRYMRTTGVDEVGVGCLAGPVISAAVCFGNKKPSVIFKDSKKLSENQREKLYKYIKQNCHVAIGIATAFEVDKINVNSELGSVETKLVLKIPSFNK